MLNKTLTDSRLSGWVWPALILTAAAFALRCWLFGNPIVHIDEQYYLLVGTRMLDGQLPFVDFWDRKPVGLFLVYAGIAAISPDAVIGYQLVATLCAAATALVIHRMALRIAPPKGALVAALAYLIYFPLLGGVGGQSPVFYNLPVALAGWITLSLVAAPKGEARWLGPKGLAVMLLLGLAIQIKYTVIFEGAFMGLALLWRGWSDRRPLPLLALFALLWVATALAPTAAAWYAYAIMGYGDLFVQANFMSFFGRYQAKLPAFARLLMHIVMFLPFFLAIRHVRREGATDRARLFAQYWAAAAILGYLLLGSYYIHYALPLLTPLALAAAPALGCAARDAKRRSLLLLVPALVIGMIWVAVDVYITGTKGQVDRMIETVQPRLKNGCLYIYEGDPIVYERTNACLMTRFIFPSHLNNRKERDALGIDVAGEVRRILADKPAVIIMRDTPRSGLTNEETRAIVKAELARNYRHVADRPSGIQNWQVWERR